MRVQFLMRVILFLMHVNKIMESEMFLIPHQYLSCYPYPGVPVRCCLSGEAPCSRDEAKKGLDGLCRLDGCHRYDYAKAPDQAG